MLRSVWLSPSPRGEDSFFSIVADVFLGTIPFPGIVIHTIFAAVMIRFMPGRSSLRQAGAEENEMRGCFGGRNVLAGPDLIRIR